MPPESAPQDLTEERMEELANGSALSGDRPEIPMTAEGDPAAPADTPAQTAAEKFFEFTHNGKTVKASEADTLKWAAQGYDYPQKLQGLNQERQKWNAEKSQWEKSWAPYQQVDAWAKANPEAWQRIQDSVAGGAPAQAAQAGDPYAQKIKHLETNLNKALEYVEMSQAEKQTAKAEAENQALDQEIKGIREKYADLPWDRVDPNTGKSLEYQVLEHCQQKQIKDFGVGFRDFYHDQLIARAEAQAKQAVSKGVQEKTRLGVLGESPTPRKGQSAPQDIKNLSYSDLERAALAEIGVGA